MVRSKLPDVTLLISDCPKTAGLIDLLEPPASDGSALCNSAHRDGQGHY
jgi:hypothetical protein